jgi:hypothetical protein
MVASRLSAFITFHNEMGWSERVNMEKLVTGLHVNLCAATAPGGALHSPFGVARNVDANFASRSQR